jgi:hypothetical protein
MEGDGTVRSLVPVRFVNAWPGQTCAPEPSAAPVGQPGS